jgi:dihydropteroate synthase
MNGRQPAVGSRQPAVDSRQSAVGGRQSAVGLRQSAAKNGPRRVLFVTGRLAEPALRRVLATTPLPFAYDVAVLRITVAALMTTAWIARSLSTPDVPDGTDLVLIPGLCEGDPQLIGDKLGLRVEKGPGDLRELPGHFGRPAATDSYGAWDIEIVAEINNAPKLTREDIRKAAEYFHASGADIIDIGCTPGLPFPALGEVVRDLVEAGRRVSVDTFDPPEIRTAVGAGAELVLSVNGSNIEIASDLAGTGARVVAVPELGGTLDTLEPTLEALARRGIPYLIDPILEPIGHGFTASIERYAETRRRHPEAEMLMGIGNLTELTAADSTGVHAVLIAICQELGIRTVLTTEVIPWARGAVREVDVARRLMHYAVTQRTIPKGVDNRLVTVKDPVLLAYPEDELRALQAGITDPNFRIFTDRDGITVLNNERFVRSTNESAPGDIFAQLGVDDASHAFYLGTELAKAGLAVALGKTYRQDQALAWGYLTPPESGKPKHIRLTARTTAVRRPRAKGRKR